MPDKDADVHLANEHHEDWSSPAKGQRKVHVPHLLEEKFKMISSIVARQCMVNHGNYHLVRKVASGNFGIPVGENDKGDPSN